MPPKRCRSAAKTLPTQKLQPMCRQSEYVVFVASMSIVDGAFKKIVSEYRLLEHHIGLHVLISTIIIIITIIPGAILIEMEK